MKNKNRVFIPTMIAMACAMLTPPSFAFEKAGAPAKAPVSAPQAAVPASAPPATPIPPASGAEKFSEKPAEGKFGLGQLALTGDGAYNMLNSAIDAKDPDGVLRLLKQGVSVELDKSKVCEDGVGTASPEASLYGSQLPEGYQETRNITYKPEGGLSRALQPQGGYLSLWPGACSRLFMLRAINGLGVQRGKGGNEVVGSALTGNHPVVVQTVESAQNGPFASRVTNAAQLMDMYRTLTNSRKIISILDERTPTAEKILYPAYIASAANVQDFDTAWFLLKRYEEAYPTIKGLNYAANPKWAPYVSVLMGSTSATTGLKTESIVLNTVTQTTSMESENDGTASGAKVTKTYTGWDAGGMLYGFAFQRHIGNGVRDRITSLIQYGEIVKATAARAPGGLPLVEPADLKFMLLRSVVKRLTVSNGAFTSGSGRRSEALYLNLDDLKDGYKYADDNGVLYKLPISASSGTVVFDVDGVRKETLVWWARKLLSDKDVLARINSQDAAGRTLVHELSRVGSGFGAEDPSGCTPASLARWIAERKETNISLVDARGLAPVGYTASLKETHPMKAALMLQDFSTFKGCRRETLRKPGK